MSVAELAPRAPSSELSETLRTGPDRFEKLVNDLFTDMESMCAALEEQRVFFEARCRRLEDEKQQLAETLAERPAGDGPIDHELQSKVHELERDRQLLEQELEEVRVRSTDLAKTLSEQKRQMADERAEWTAELRQLRRVLDKQASWIAQQSRSAPAELSGYGEGDVRPAGSGDAPPMPAAANPTPAPAAPQNRDPVLGSVMSQFELLRKDLERRRSQSGAAGK